MPVYLIVVAGIVVAVAAFFTVAVALLFRAISKIANTPPPGSPCCDDY